jgi:outer membrane protein assembly factor BamB
LWHFVLNECNRAKTWKLAGQAEHFQKDNQMHIFAVIPIVINGGVAALPAIVAAVASVAAILFKPRALMQLLRSRWLLSSVLLGGLILFMVAAMGWRRAGSGVRRAGRIESHEAGRIDWAKVAEDIIAQERVRQASGNLAEQAVDSAASAGGTILAAQGSLPSGWQDFSRTHYRGGPSPAGLNPLWSFKPEGTVFFGVPAIVGKRIFAAGCQADLGAYTGLLACLDFDTGKPLWQTTESGQEPLRPFFSSPAVTPDGKYLVIGQGLHQDRDCSLLCFDTATGQQVWAVKTPLHIESSPAIYGDMAVVGAGAIEGDDGKAVGDPGFVLAVHIPDGKLLWKQPVNDPESSPAIDENGTVFIGSGCNGQAVVAIRSQPGEELQTKKLDRIAWRTASSQPMLAPVTLAGNVVIAAGGNGDYVHSGRSPQGLVMALERQTGKVLWQTPLDDAVLAAVACQDGMLICPVRNGEVVALALGDGRILWRSRVGGNAPVLAGCAVTPDRIYAVSSDGYLAALANGDGKVLEKFCLNDQSQPGTGLSLSSPQVLDNRILVGSETGGLRCLQGSGGGQ